jgi:branched-chain amino acid transport system ATP-binding protein
MIPVATAVAEPLLRVDDIEVVYDQIILAVRGVTLEVPRGAIVALLGANGAGKTTTLKAISGLLGAERGAVTRGSIRYQGRSVAALGPRALVAEGVAQVLEGRRCFRHLTVEENLTSGALVRRLGRAALTRELDGIYALFPRLRERRDGPAGLLSGGEQQMVALGRALMSRPRLLLLDEPSMGLAPQVVAEIFRTIRTLNEREGMTVLVAEQNANLALQFAHHAYVLENGRVALEGPARALAERPDIKSFYLGLSAAGVRRRARAGAPGTPE